MSISSVNGTSFFSPFGILSSFADPTEGSEATDAASTEPAADSSADAAAATTPSAPANSPALLMTNLLDAVTQLGGGLAMNPNSTAAEDGNAATAAGNNSPATSLQARLHELFQKLANATAEGGPGLSLNGGNGQRVGRGHEHFQHHQQRSEGAARHFGGHRGGAAADASSAAGGNSGEVANQDPAALLHQVIATLGQLSQENGAAATTSAQTGASYDIMAQLQTTGSMLDLKAE